MLELLANIRKCTHCSGHLELGPKPVMSAHPKSQLVIIGQAPGTRVHETGIPWNDPSGKNLRKWMQINEEEFYNPEKVAIVPMGFCYPGKGKSGDLPPRPECAPLWHRQLLDQMQDVKLTLLIGQYAQRYYLKDQMKSTLTETVRNFREYLPKFLPLPHPSPRNNIWMKKNPWFEQEVLAELRTVVRECLEK